MTEKKMKRWVGGQSTEQTGQGQHESNTNWK